MKGVVLEIDRQTAISFLLPRHYSGRTPSISKAFGWYTGKPFTEDELKAVVTYGKPATNSLCVGICGEKYASNVYELNRLCRVEDWNEPLSAFVSATLRRLRTQNWIIVSYSDMAMNHHGYIYQACNFIYTGQTKERTDMFVAGGGHSRHAKSEDQGKYRVFRSAKHRYVYFCTFNKSLKKAWNDALNYPVLQYPKGDNSPDYDLGHFAKPITLDSTTGEQVSKIEMDNEQLTFWG